MKRGKKRGGGELPGPWGGGSSMCKCANGQWAIIQHRCQSCGAWGWGGGGSRWAVSWGWEGSDGKKEAFEVEAFGEGEGDGVIGGLVVSGDDASFASGIGCGFGEHGLE